MPSSQRLSTFYHGHRIGFGAQFVRGLGFLPVATISDLCNLAAGEIPIDIPIEPYDTEAAACQQALLAAMSWIEDRCMGGNGRDAFVAIAWIADDDFEQLAHLAAQAQMPLAGGRSTLPSRGEASGERESGDHLAALIEPPRLPHDAWLQATLTAERAASEDGLVPVRIPIRPAPFVRWCETHNVAPDRVAHGRYAQWLLDGRPI